MKKYLWKYLPKDINNKQVTKSASITYIYFWFFVYKVCQTLQVLMNNRICCGHYLRKQRNLFLYALHINKTILHQEWIFHQLTW